MDRTFHFAPCLLRRGNSTRFSNDLSNSIIDGHSMCTRSAWRNRKRMRKIRRYCAQSNWNCYWVYWLLRIGRGAIPICGLRVARPCRRSRFTVRRGHSTFACTCFVVRVVSLSPGSGRTSLVGYASPSSLVTPSAPTLYLVFLASYRSFVYRGPYARVRHRIGHRIRDVHPGSGPIMHKPSHRI